VTLSDEGLGAQELPGVQSGEGGEFDLEGNSLTPPSPSFIASRTVPGRRDPPTLSSSSRFLLIVNEGSRFLAFGGRYRARGAITWPHNHMA